MNVLHAYMGEIVAKRGEDGTLFVYGKATGPDLDMDRQICDADWLASAMPQWMKSGANIREQHSSIASGVGIELDTDGASWFLKGEIVDPVSAKKVEKGVLKGYSIGIKNARVIKDKEAPGGRIVGGDIVEISLVDRPANPTATIEIAKSVNGTLELVKGLEPLIPDTQQNVGNAPSAKQDLTIEPIPGTKDNSDPYPNANVCDACHGTGQTSDTYETCVLCDGTGFEKPTDDAQRLNAEAPVDQSNAIEHQEKEVEADVAKKDYTDAERQDMADAGQAMKDGAYPIKTVKDLKNAIQAMGRAKDRVAVMAHIKSRAKSLGREDLIPDSMKEVVHDLATLNQVRSGLVELIKAELDEIAKGEENEICDISELLCTLQWFLCWWEDEFEGGETEAPFTKLENEEMEGSEDMAYVGLGVSADLIKRVSADTVTDEDRDEFRSEIVKALGLGEVIAKQDMALADQAQVIENLALELAVVKSMATPGGPALRQTSAQAQKATDADRLKAQSARYADLATQITDPSTKALYVQKAIELAEDANRILKG